MYESDAQNRIANVIITENPEELTAAISDNEFAVIIEAGEYDAAYTADEARNLTESILNAYHQRGWGENIVPSADYIQDLADIVDNNLSVEEVDQKWNYEGQLGSGEAYGIFDEYDGGPYMSFTTKQEASRFCVDWNNLPDPIEYVVVEASEAP